MICPRCNTELAAQARFCSHCGGSAIGDGGTSPAKKKTSPLVLLLIVGGVGFGALMMCGIIAAIAIPNLLNAIDRGKQKRTMADIRSIGAAVEAYVKQQGALPELDDLDSLRPLLEPDYIRRLPPQDGWGHRLTFSSDAGGYRIASPGKNGEFEECGGGRTELFAGDICFENSLFTQWPEGMQH